MEQPISWKVTLWLDDVLPWQHGPESLAAACNGTKWPDGVEMQSASITPMKPSEADKRRDPPNIVWAMGAYLVQLAVMLFGPTWIAAFYLPRYGWPVYLVAVPIVWLAIYCSRVVGNYDNYLGRLEG